MTGPHYLRVKSHVGAAIAGGELRPGDRLPSEAELVERFAVSRMTVSRALNELAREGLVERVQGVGSFVAVRRSETAMLEVRDIAEEVARRGGTYGCRVLVLSKGISGTVGRLMGLGAEAVHYHSVIVHLADGVPLQIETRFVNPDFAPDYLAQDFSTATPYAYLMSLGPLQAAEHAIEARRVTVEEARRLEIEDDEPAIVLKRRTWSRNKVASVATLVAPAGRQRFIGSFGTPPDGAARLPSL
ncbi:MAG: UTRA domain-containing protein [Hyphomicrobiaceae bacterium]